MCKAMGLDLSLTSTGMVVLKTDGTAESMTLTSKFKDAVRLADLSERSRWPSSYTARNLLSSRVTRSAARRRRRPSRVGRCSECALFEMQPFLVVPPARLKFACGKGNAKKDEVRLRYTSAGALKLH